MPSGYIRRVRSSRCATWHCEWLMRAFLVVFCLVNVAVAQDETPAQLTDSGEGPLPQSTSPSELVRIAREGAVPELDAEDPSRYERIAGQQASMVYSLDETVSGITLVVYFHQDTDEQVTLVEGDTFRPSVRSQDTQARISDSDNLCSGTAVRNRGELEVCLLMDTNWFRVTWSPTLTGCQSEITVRLEGVFVVLCLCKSGAFQLSYCTSH